MNMKGGCTMHWIIKILVIIGGINWGLVGLGMLLGTNGGWNVVNMIFGSVPTLEAIIYLLVGISAVAMIFGCKCSKCMAGAGDSKMSGSM
jgi:uncharacterized membrane protein YuzA (DUF378 family)